MIGAMFETNINYKKLDKLIEDEITNIKYSNNVNVIIDLKSVFKKAYRMDIDNLLKDFHVDIEDITSHVMNMIGHYRNYLYKHGKYSTFYLLYSKTPCKELQKENSDYKKYYYDKYFSTENEFKNLNNIIKSSVHSIEILAKYVPNVFFIDTSLTDEFIYCNFLIREHLNKNDINIILSSDILMYQALSKNTFAIDLKGANSHFITEQNVIHYLTDKDTKISGNLLTLMISMCGDETYSLNKINNIGFKKSLKIIEDLVNQNAIIDKMYMQLPEKEIIINSTIQNNIELLKTNFKIIFPIELQITKYHDMNTKILLIESSKPKVTLRQFKELNERVYLLFPLNIPSLLKGESVS